MKRHGLLAVILMAVVALMAACGAAYPADLVSADNAVGVYFKGQLAPSRPGTAYGDIIQKLGATGDERLGGQSHRGNKTWWTEAAFCTCRLTG